MDLVVAENMVFLGIVVPGLAEVSRKRWEVVRTMAGVEERGQIMTWFAILSSSDLSYRF